MIRSVWKINRLANLHGVNILCKNFGESVASADAVYLYLLHNTRHLSSISKVIRNHKLSVEIFPVTTMATSSSGATHRNRLADEKSPYLLQHATNPVDWYPWGVEAIEKAKSENKLIFLSVGYSTCHWCHVMEKESFENEDVAKIMNEHFVNIKVDREERPDIDKIYMNFLLMINGSGGWPMSVWLTPDLAPVTAGTYFPPTDRWGMSGFSSILKRIAHEWKKDSKKFIETGTAIITAMQKSALINNLDGSDSSTSAANTATSIEEKFMQAINIFSRNIDKEWGGFGGGRGPKFPEVSKLNFLLHAHVQLYQNATFASSTSSPPSSSRNVLQLVTETLRHIGRGGIHDHVFGGFARYSVDRKWHVPHFEKMLYDQGQLLAVYSNAYKLTKDKQYLEIADGIFNYICVDLQHPSGGFYSGEDADSYPNSTDDPEKIEGAFYAWTQQEIHDIIEENSEKFPISVTDAIEIYCMYYGVKDTGNVDVASDPHGHLTGKNILMICETLENISKKYSINIENLQMIIKDINKLLYEVRKRRPRPHLDTKIITSWNGLVLSGLSKLACIQDAPNRTNYLAQAKKQMEFIRKKLYNEETFTLLRSCYGAGTTNDITEVSSDPIDGFLDDYAFLIKGLLDYYVATLDTNALHWAKRLQQTQDELFWDTENHGYFYSKENSPNVIVRLKEDHDGAEPCGNSVSATNLLLLSGYFDEKQFKHRANDLFKAFSHLNPLGSVMPELMSGHLLQEHGLSMIVIVGKSDESETKNLIDASRNFYIPGLLLIHIDTDTTTEGPLASSSTTTTTTTTTRLSAPQQFKAIKGQPTAYLCQNKICQLPIISSDKLSENLSMKYIFT